MLPRDRLAQGDTALPHEADRKYEQYGDDDDEKVVLVHAKAEERAVREGAQGKIRDHAAEHG